MLSKAESETTIASELDTNVSLYDHGPSFTEQLIAANLGLHFSSESEDDRGFPDEPDLPTVAQATGQTVEKTASRVKAAKKLDGSKRTTKKKNDDDGETNRQVQRLIRETHASLPIQVAKPKSFATLTTIKQADRLQLLKRKLTPEQYGLLRKQPQLTADDSVGREDRLMVIANSRRLGRREGWAGIPIPKSKPASIDRLNRDLDAKILSQGRMHEHIKQAIYKKRKHVPRSKLREEEAVQVARVPFGYDLVKAIQKERKKPDKEDADSLLYPEENGNLVHTEDLNPLMYPDEQKDHPTAAKESCTEGEASEGSLVSHESASGKGEKDEEDAIDAFERKRESQPKSLRSLFIDDEAESGDDDDEEKGKSGLRTRDNEWYKLSSSTS